jgi:hypothetical protein
MRPALLTISLLMVWATTLEAQHAARFRSHGYVFTAPGITSPGSTGTLHFGAGFEGFVYKGLGAGAEIGYLSPAQDLGCGFGLFSVNGSYHFLNARSRRGLSPFVTGGYSLAFRNGRANMLNLGGGVTYWFLNRLGLRLEVRDQLWSPTRNAAHFVDFRIGMALR